MGRIDLYQSIVQGTAIESKVDKRHMHAKEGHVKRPGFFFGRRKVILKLDDKTECKLSERYTKEFLKTVGSPIVQSELKRGSVQDALNCYKEELVGNARKIEAVGKDGKTKKIYDVKENYNIVRQNLVSKIRLVIEDTKFLNRSIRSIEKSGGMIVAEDKNGRWRAILCNNELHILALDVSKKKTIEEDNKEFGKFLQHAIDYFVVHEIEVENVHVEGNREELENLKVLISSWRNNKNKIGSEPMVDSEGFIWH